MFIVSIAIVSIVHLENKLAVVYFWSYWLIAICLLNWTVDTFFIGLYNIIKVTPLFLCVL